jgi:hypothetical protein
VALLKYEDGVTEIVIQSTFHFDSRSPVFRAFTEALYALHDVAPLGEYDVDKTASLPFPTYHVAFLTSLGRTFEQDIQKQETGFFVRQAVVSSYFTLTELLLNNNLRTSVQNLIDGFDVFDIAVEFI